MTLTEANITCPHTHFPLVRITADGISVRCQHCSVGEHSLTWQEVETRRAAVTTEPAEKPLERLSPLALPQYKKRKRGGKNDTP